jgi:Aspartyl protease
MPCISGNYNPAVGIIVQIAILPQSQLSALQMTGQPVSPPNITMFAALLDTGASVTCISKNVVQKLGLQPSGKTSMSGSTGAQTVDQYAFLVGFIFGAQQAPTGAVSGQLSVNLVQGCEFTNHGFGFDVLIGRDILCKGTLNMSFDGHFVLAL